MNLKNKKIAQEQVILLPHPCIDLSRFLFAIDCLGLRSFFQAEGHNMHSVVDSRVINKMNNIKIA